MASFNPQDFGFDEPPPRPTTPPVRRGFLLVLFLLSLAALAVYGSIYVAERIGYAWESGRARADMEALARLDQAGIVNRASALFRMATAAVSPAVVNVQSSRERRGGEGFPGLPIGGNRMTPSFQSSELGSGVIIDKAKGYVVTNNHVVKDADRIMVRLGPGDEVPARLVGADPKSDLAVLQIKADLKVQAEWGDSEQLDTGEWVLAIGSPLGFDHSVTAGIVSATERNGLQLAEYESFIQTDAAINPGNSGGPLVNLAGKVVGINTAIITKSGGYEGIGLAIPSSQARRVVESLIKDGKVVRGYLGVRLDPRPLDPKLAKNLHLPSNRGALVVDVQPGSPADQVGLKADDVIVKLANHDVADMANLRNLTAGLDAGAKVPLIFYRGGEPKTTTVTIGELPAEPEILATLGFNVHEVRERQVDNVGHGTYVEINRVISGSPAFHKGLRPGMRIVAVGTVPEPVTTLAEFEAAVGKTDLSRGLPMVLQTPDGRRGAVVVESGNANTEP
jgi:serine protease Do